MKVDDKYISSKNSLSIAVGCKVQDTEFLSGSGILTNNQVGIYDTVQNQSTVLTCSLRCNPLCSYRTVHKMGLNGTDLKKK